MKKTTRFLVPLLLLLLILASIVWYLFVYDRAFTRDTLLSQARFNDLHGNARLSSWFYDMAYRFSGHDENVAVELANQYKGQGNYTKAELTLTTALNDEPTAELYQNLSKTYVQQDKLLDSVNLLDSIADPAIKAELEQARPAAPMADFESGYYSKYMNIHLHSSPDTAIYYTTDGTYPTMKGSVYSGSISLPAGETTVYAIAVNRDGLVSPLTVLGYTVTGVIEEVSFVDPTMEAAIRQKIGVGEGKAILSDALWGITEFTVPEGVSNYDDLALLPYLTNLTIHQQNIPSLAPLSTLTSLVELNLSGSTFPAEDLAILAALPGLKHLELSGCGISTIAGLEGAPSLTYLDLSNNTVRNLEVLEPMTSLTELYLQHNAVRDLSSVGVLTGLIKLDLSYNSISNLAPLAHCGKLNWLAADHNQILTLDGISTMPQLSYLSLDSNALTDVSVLGGNVELRTLNIAGNDITDISALRTLTKLEDFNFSYNKVEALPQWPSGCALKTIRGSYNALASIDVLSKMDSLTHVYMDYNLLTSIDALAENFCLVQVNVFGNEIDDVSKLREHDIIVNYDPT